jgi:hypothetical protein
MPNVRKRCAMSMLLRRSAALAFAAVLCALAAGALSSPHLPDHATAVTATTTVASSDDSQWG